MARSGWQRMGIGLLGPLADTLLTDGIDAFG
jgi:hypothetical protein